MQGSLDSCRHISDARLCVPMREFADYVGHGLPVADRILRWTLGP